jgi:hypothetical protein
VQQANPKQILLLRIKNPSYQQQQLLKRIQIRLLTKQFRKRPPLLKLKQVLPLHSKDKKLLPQVMLLSRYSSNKKK